MAFENGMNNSHEHKRGIDILSLLEVMNVKGNRSSSENMLKT